MKENNLKTIFTYLFICFILCNCTTFTGEPIEKTFELPSTYTELQVEDAIDVIISNEQDQISVITTEKIINDIIIDNIDNKLHIYVKKKFHINTPNIEVILPYNSNLQKIKLSGAAEFKSILTLKNKEIDIDLSGASDLKCDIEADKIKIKLSGASDASLSGKTNTLAIELSGASNITKKIIDNHYSLVCNQCECNLSGASDAYIHCNDNINIINLSGASNLHYTGNAKITLNDGNSIAGSSNISHDTL